MRLLQVSPGCFVGQAFPIPLFKAIFVSFGRKPTISSNQIIILNFEFIFTYPVWFFLICIALAGGVTALLYFRNRRDDFSNKALWLLSIARFLSLATICFLLLAPLLKMNFTITQEPVILIFHDNSKSVIIGNTPKAKANELNIGLNRLVNLIAQKHPTAVYTFGSQVRKDDSLTFNENITDISEVFSEIEAAYSNRNIGAVVIASDGIYNRGQNPIIRTTRLTYPVYTIALGDTVPRKDLSIKKINHNRITYLNNFFPLEISIEALQSARNQSRLRVTHQGKTVHDQNISINSDTFFQTIALELEATETGMKRYRVELTPIEGEISTENNVTEFFIEVIDSRQKVLIMALSPHPDVGALKEALSTSQNFETEVALIREFRGNLADFDVIIWHQIPSQAIVADNLLTQANRLGKAQLFIIGAGSNLAAFNRLQTGIQVNARASGFTDSRAEFNPAFTLFRFETEATDLLPILPPLQTPFATYNLSPAAQVLAYQRIGNVTTQYPLIAFVQTTERKTGFIAGEGIWRWRLSNFARQNNHNAFNDLITKIIQYLNVVDDKNFFRVTGPGFVYQNQPAIFDAELYNPSYELINTPEVSLVITNEENIGFEYTMSRTANAYRLNAGVFQVGEYRYLAQTTLGNETFTASGIFTVAPLNIESVNTIADHQLLFQIARNSGGEMFYQGQDDELAQAILNRTDIMPVLYNQYRYQDMINFRWLFFAILLLLSTEWFFRKFMGSY